jgi:uncharacterized protein (TIRG00374 family)
MTKRHVLMLIQGSVSILLFWYLFSKIDFASSLNGIRNAQPWLLLAGLAQLAIQPFVSGLRWKLILRALGRELPFGTTVRFVWIGAFFSQALPGTVGGDVVRIWLYWKSGAGHRLAINSVAIDRIIMVLSLLMLVTAVQPGLMARNQSPMAAWLPALMLAIAVCGTAMLMFSDRIIKRFDRWPAIRTITHVAADLRAALLHPMTFAAITAISVLAYLNMAITGWLIALALGLPLTLIDCCILIPVVLLASIIPISVGGWGIREGAMVVLLAGVGVAAEGALALSVLFGVTSILVSLPGALIWLGGGYRRTDLDEAASLAGDALQKKP